MRNFYWTITILLVVAAVSLVTVVDYVKRNPDCWLANLGGSHTKPLPQYKQYYSTGGDIVSAPVPMNSYPAPSLASEVPSPNIPPGNFETQPMPPVVQITEEERQAMVQKQLASTRLFSSDVGTLSPATAPVVTMEHTTPPEPIPAHPRKQEPASPFAEKYVAPPPVVPTLNLSQTPPIAINFPSLDMSPTASATAPIPPSITLLPPPVLVDTPGPAASNSTIPPSVPCDNSWKPGTATSQEVVVRFYPLGALIADMNTSEEAVIELLCGMIAPETWQTKGGNGNVVYFAPGKCLIVRHHAGIQSQVGEFVSKLRASVEGQLGSNGEVNALRVTNKPSPLPPLTPVQMEIPEPQAIPKTRVITEDPAGSCMEDLLGIFPVMKDGRLVPVAATINKDKQNEVIPASFEPKRKDCPPEAPDCFKDLPDQPGKEVRPASPKYLPPLMPLAFHPLPKGPSFGPIEFVDLSNYLLELFDGHVSGGRKPPE